jgi:hydroxymethylglutaryl-CoA lyase
VRPEQAVAVARRLAETGCDEVSIGDTIGVAVPTQVGELIGRLAEHIPLERVAVHFHDTRGTALANVLAALECGVTVVDSSCGGTGGCPYAPGASGNLGTEDLLYMLHGMGIETGVELESVRAASLWLAGRLGRPLPSRYLAAGPEPAGSEP